MEQHLDDYAWSWRSHPWRVLASLALWAAPVVVFRFVAPRAWPSPGWPTWMAFGMQVINRFLLPLFAWGFPSAIAYNYWRSVAGDELCSIGLGPPPWWLRPVIGFPTLRLIRENRGRLPGGGVRLYRWGLVAFWNAWLSGMLFFALILFIAAVAGHARALK